VTAAAGTPAPPARVELSAYCVEPADLARIAHLLGVPSTDDDHPNLYGSRYRWVRRDFGRVSLRAYTSIDPEPSP
jgi:hypothetical protein